MNLIDIIKRVTPPFHEVRKDIELLKLNSPTLTTEKLAELYGSKIRNKYTSVGVASSLPGAIPGVGTIAQIAIETGSISADVLLMLRWMASIAYGTAYIYGQDIENDFDAEFTTMLGLWAGILTPAEAAETKSSLLTTEHFDKHIADRIRNRLNQKVGRKLVAKFGAKRTGLIGGKLIPFGIGAVIGGAFNYTTMKRFAKVSNDYFKPSV